jgi:Uma2 family endonuclease
VEQRLLLHNISWQSYVAIGDALSERPALRLTYDRGNLEIRTTSAPPAPTAWTSDTQRLLLHDVTWRDYDTLLHALEGHHLRTTYDRGSLEIITLSPEHEGDKNLVRRFIEVLAEECNLSMKNLGSTTQRREDLDRGLEPDECYYFQNWQRMRGKKRLDLTTDPPPDLVVEIDITQSSLDRMKIYAALGVSEVWRFDGVTLRIYRLNAERSYAECDSSPTFPALPVKELPRFVRQAETDDDITVLRAIRAWVREQLAKKPASPTPGQRGRSRKKM